MLAALERLLRRLKAGLAGQLEDDLLGGLVAHSSGQLRLGRGVRQRLGDQFEVGRTEMKKYGFKGVFFIMTVSIGKKHYMSTAQIKQLSDEGNVIGSHTWNHSNFKKFAGKDWAPTPAKAKSVGFIPGEAKPYVHRISNQGKTAYHVIDVEILP